MIPLGAPGGGDTCVSALTLPCHQERWEPGDGKLTERQELAPGAGEGETEKLAEGSLNEDRDEGKVEGDGGM